MAAAQRRLAVIGAGPMGLAAAYFASQAGWRVDVYEAADRPGGMAAHFDLNGLSIERFYHFCCRSDTETETMLAELGLPPLRWANTRMGYFVNGALHPWGDPIALLRFPHLNLLDKLRYGLQAFTSLKRSDWRRLDQISAVDWFRRWCGAQAYDLLWRPLFELKFHEYAGDVSAAWAWQRIKRLGQSRRSLFQEELGYMEGGSETLVTAMAAAITSMGGQIHLSTRVKRIVIQDDRATGLELADGGQVDAEQIISTVALPYAARLLSDREDLAQIYANFRNIGVVCVVHELAKPVSDKFWVNVSDPAMNIPGFVEFSNLRPVGRNIVYVPYYMPTSHPDFNRSDESFMQQSFDHLRRVNPTLQASDRLASHVARLTCAQPVCDVGFAARIPSERTPVAGLQVADTSFYYPEDRGLSESIGFARRLVRNLADV